MLGFAGQRDEERRVITELGGNTPRVLSWGIEDAGTAMMQRRCGMQRKGICFCRESSTAPERGCL
jgi:hypothetical protein